MGERTRVPRGSGRHATAQPAGGTSDGGPGGHGDPGGGPGGEPVLTMTGIRKHFGPVVALDDVDFRMLPGEVHALMGENGAGKSTLIKVLTGVYGQDAGEIVFDGRRVRFEDPAAAQAGGVSTVYQEVNLCTNLSVAENVFIGREPRRRGFIDFPSMRRRAAELMERLQVDVDVSRPLSSFSLAIQQMVAIARALDVDARALVLDEPTSSLDQDEVAELFRVLRDLRDDGLAILFVSHFLEQVYEISDRMTVLRNGELVGEYVTAEMPRVDLVAAMIGKDLDTLSHLDDRVAASGQGGSAAQVVLEADGLGRKGSIQPYDLTIHEGEVLGFAGLLGAGRTEAARLLFGADTPDTGELYVDGERVHMKSPRVAMAHDVAFSSENRRTEGLIEELTVRENIILALQAARGWSRPLSGQQQHELVERYISALQIRPPDPEMLAGNLSGGNQQKLLLARWLATRPRLLILDEPTRGIDVGAKAEIQKLVVDLASDGMAVLYISAELAEVLRLSHRVAILRDRQMVTVLDNDRSVTTETVMETIATGGDE